MKRMIPNAYLEVKDGKLTAYKGIYDAEGNQIIADGGSIVEGNPSVPEGTTPTEMSGISVQNGGETSYYKITHSPVVEANPDMSGQSPTALSGLKVGNSYYKPFTNPTEEMLQLQGAAGNLLEMKIDAGNTAQFRVNTANPTELVFTQIYNGGIAHNKDLVVNGFREIFLDGYGATTICKRQVVKNDNGELDFLGNSYEIPYADGDTLTSAQFTDLVCKLLNAKIIQFEGENYANCPIQFHFGNSVEDWYLTCSLLIAYDLDASPATVDGGTIIEVSYNSDESSLMFIVYAK